MALVGEWGFNENTGATAAPEDIGPTIANVPAWGEGHGGSPSSMHVDGVGPSFTPYPVTGRPLTVMLWLKPLTFNGYQSIIYQANGVWWFEYDGDGNLEWYAEKNLPGPQLALGEWVHLAITADGTTRSLYVNGTLYGSVDSAQLASNNSFEFGGGGQPLSALVDDLRVYDHALTETEISALMDTPIAPVPTGTTNTTFLGSVQPSRVYLGDTEAKMYLGSTLVYGDES